jgi:hypothetical protein
MMVDAEIHTDVAGYESYFKSIHDKYMHLPGAFVSEQVADVNCGTGELLLLDIEPIVKVEGQHLTDDQAAFFTGNWSECSQQGVFQYSIGYNTWLK